jgi:hypothetical protein
MASFRELDSQTQKDLADWLNVRNPDGADKRRLANLHAKGLFRAWDCPNCGDRVFLGEPKDWGNFQGVHQADYTSYPPVNQATRTWCDHCRCYHQGKVSAAKDLAAEIFK